MKFSFKLFFMVFIAITLTLSACGGSSTTETQTEDQVNNSAPGQIPPIPAEISGEVVYVPFPVKITLDGDLSD